MNTYLTFKTAGVGLAADLTDIIRIIPASEMTITAAPNFPAYMPGTAVIDGEAVPVIDTAVRFGLAEKVIGERACCILSPLDPSSGMAERYTKCAVLVDEVSGMISADRLAPPPAVNKDSFARYIKGTFIRDDVTYYVISPELLVM